MIRKSLLAIILTVCVSITCLSGYIAALEQAQAAPRQPTASRAPASRNPADTQPKVDDTVVFSDMANHWAESSATRLFTLELVEGYPDKTYKPDQLVNKLESVVMILRSGGFTAEAEKLAAQLEKQSNQTQQNNQSNQRSGNNNSRNSGRNNTTAPATQAPVQVVVEDRKTPLVPWGQAYVDLAIDKGFLQLSNPTVYDHAGPASRLEVAELLARAMYLLPPDYHAGSTQENLTFNPGMATDEFADLDMLSMTERTVVAAVTNAGVMTGYPDGSFRPYDFLTRAEAATVLSRLVDMDWVKVSAERRLEGWISRLAINKDIYELTLTNLTGERKIKVSPKVKCYRNETLENIVQAKNYRCEVVLDAKKEAGWIRIIEPKSVGTRNNLRCSVKMVILGEENFLLVSDMYVTEHKIPIAWDAVIAGGKSTRSFSTLKMGDFADVQLENGEVKLVTLLEVKKKSGTVDRIQNSRLYLRGATTSHPS
ncbi:MAG: S-layer homology domain-containing protein, partial [Peptococcaceae bacterium]|nr:S-layer homology domain-containing protein [Peptococcaceae bacterium]